MESLLAVDYGRKRVGLAGCDPLGITVVPLRTLETGRDRVLDAIAEVCAERDVTRVVVGLPLNMDGSEGDMAREVRAFAARVADRTGLPVDLFDERLTSFVAEEAMRQLPKKARRERGRVDAMAAVQILRDYLARRERGGT